MFRQTNLTISKSSRQRQTKNVSHSELEFLEIGKINSYGSLGYLMSNGACLWRTEKLGSAAF